MTWIHMLTSLFATVIPLAPLFAFLATARIFWVTPILSPLPVRWIQSMAHFKQLWNCCPDLCVHQRTPPDGHPQGACWREVKPGSGFSTCWNQGEHHHASGSHSLRWDPSPWQPPPGQLTRREELDDVDIISTLMFSSRWYTEWRTNHCSYVLQM